MADAVDIITLDEAKTFLNMLGTASDTELPDFITAASRMWTQRVGPVNSTAFDEWHDGYGSRIMLRHTPVLTVTLVEESYGPILYTLTETYGTWTYTLDESTGLLTRRAVGVAIPFARGQRNIHVTYTAGYATPPADIKKAVGVLLLHLWETQRGGAKRFGQGGTDDYHPVSAYGWPSRAEMTAAAYLVPGIA